MKTRQLSKIGLPLLIVTLALSGCSSAGEDSAIVSGEGNYKNGNNGRSENNQNQNNSNSVVVEREFNFARPATVGQTLFVANETLNTVAAIDAVSLRIETIPVGFRPTVVVGPTVEAVDETHVFVLNQGSSTVSVVEPETLTVNSFGVMRHANAMAANPSSTVAVVWFDSSETTSVPPDADISAVNIVTPDFEAQIAVGFNVRGVEFSDDGAYVIVITDDGISRLEVAAIDGDSFAPPVAIEAQGFANPNNVEVLVDPSGRYVVSRITGFAGLVLLDLETSIGTMIRLPAHPSDVDWVAGTDLSILVMLPAVDHFFTATIPEGLLGLEGVFDPSPPPDVDMGTMPDADMDDAGMDMPASDMDAADMGASDMADQGVDSGPDADPDMPSNPSSAIDPMVDGVVFVELEVFGMNLSEVAPDGSTALIFDGGGRRIQAVVVEALATHNNARTVTFEKPVYAAKADPAGETFVVIHTKEPGEIPPGAGPADPEFIARSWALTLLDVKSTFGQLVLTEFQTNELSMYSDPSQRVLYVTFVEGPGNKDVLVANLVTFSTSSFKVASPTDGIGPIEGQQMIYVSQEHPQGRLSFVNVETQKRRTVTGYELNAGID